MVLDCINMGCCHRFLISTMEKDWLINAYQHRIICNWVIWAVLFFIFPLSFQTRDALFFGLFYTVLGAMFALYGKQILSVLNARPMIYLASFFVFSALEIIERYWLVNIQHSKPGDYFISTIFLSASLFLFVLSSPGLGKNSFFSKVGKKFSWHLCSAYMYIK